MTGRPRILHLHSTFKLGGKEARDVDLMNHFGDRYEHILLSAEPHATAAADLIDPRVPFRLAYDAPPLAGPHLMRRLSALGSWLRSGGFNLVLSFNFGAMDGVLANRLTGRRPLVHHEDGFNEDETVRQKPERIAYRRLALPAARSLVVPSATLERIALNVWRQRPPKLQRVPNGIDMNRFASGPEPDVIPGLERGPDTVVVGTLAGLRRVKNIPRLVRVFAAAAAQAPSVNASLVIVGSGPEEAAVRAEAERLGVSAGVLMPGFLPHPHRFVGHFDIFALSSDSEQFPISLVEAMAAGLPAAATRVGDVADIVAAENLPFLASPDDEPALGLALARLMRDPALRQTVGAANRVRVAREFTRDAMIRRYESIYGQALNSGRR